MLKKGNTMKVRDIENKIPELITDTFNALPFVDFVDVQREAAIGNGGNRADFLATINIEQKSYTLIIAAKTAGQPRLARQAVNQFLRLREEQPGAYPLFIAPYISPAAAAICREADVGYLDWAGNAYITFGLVYIDRQGRKNPYISKRELKSLYNPASSRILRVLLSNPGQNWKTSPLSEEADVSIGQVSNVRKQLKDREWIMEDRDGFKLSKPKELLEEWQQNYDFAKNKLYTFYSLKKIGDLEQQVGELCQEKDIQYALTSFSGAARIAPNVRYKYADIYVADRIPEMAAKLDLKPVTSGANVRLLLPYDPRVFYGTSTIDGLCIASPVQVYLDVMSQKGRGEEAALPIFKQIMEQKWH